MNESVISQHETANRRLAYTEDFKKIISENPGVLKSFRIIEEKLFEGKLEVGDIFIEGELKVTIISYEGRDYHPGAHNRKKHLKVEIGSDKFFVKYLPGYFEKGLGFDEFNSLQKVKELLRDFENVEVIDFQLGYQDNKGSTYFVSKWLDYVRLMDYRTQDKLEKAYIYNLMSKLHEVLDVDFNDFGSNNVLYSPIEQKFFIFDIHHKDTV